MQQYKYLPLYYRGVWLGTVCMIEFIKLEKHVYIYLGSLNLWFHRLGTQPRTLYI